jgi:predicted nucleic acid-binding protein
MTRSPLVIDASVAAKWIKHEIHSAHAAHVLVGPYVLYAPDLLWPEVGNILWKSVQRGELTPEEAREGLRTLLRYPITVTACRSLIPTALGIALRHQQTVYDALYVALAATRDCRLVTADKPLYSALQATPLRKHLLWIEDVPVPK